MRTVCKVCGITAICYGLTVNVTTLAFDIPGNLAPNPSFELPENGSGQPPGGWGVFALKQPKACLTDKIAYSGRQSLVLSAQETANAFEGVTFAMPVSEGEKYDFEVHYIGDKIDRPGGTLYIVLVIEWKRADGSEIARAVSPPLKASQISRLRWNSMAIRRAVVPKGAVKAVFGIHCCDGDRGGSGTVYFDNVVILRK